MHKVKATMRGLYNHQRIEPEKVFMIKHPKEFSHVWMKSLDSKLDAILKGGPKKAIKSAKDSVELVVSKPRDEDESDELKDTSEPESVEASEEMTDEVI